MTSEKFTMYGGQRGGGKIFHLEQVCGRLMNELKQARGERDVVTKRMIELEQMLGLAIGDMKRAGLAGDLCVVCSNNREISPCEEADFDCGRCAAGCACKTCVNGENFVWRGHGDA